MKGQMATEEHAENRVLVHRRSLIRMVDGACIEEVVQHGEELEAPGTFVLGEVVAKLIEFVVDWNERECSGSCFLGC